MRRFVRVRRYVIVITRWDKLRETKHRDEDGARHKSRQCAPGLPAEAVKRGDDPGKDYQIRPDQHHQARAKTMKERCVKIL